MCDLWRKKRQANIRQKPSEVLLSMLDVVSHPHHQGLKDGLLIRHVDVITGQQLNYLIRGEKKKLLVLNDLQKVFLVKETPKGADNHQS